MDEKKKSGIKAILAKLEQATDEENEKVMWDKALDIIEMLIEDSKTKIDDWTIKPLIKIVRRRFDIPDND
jgi:hypothetical protein